ncbi:hypothetical protein BCR44DRAFT_1429685 [Catenaria anguillulae PL171]|uniref:Uncharacterized protein n=1 Tax=Catenaria anguillulae PL171 TaxID=765915 RepID=A0A1Y2HSV7_9FUNG|nr:hypothetical protein BCR44DRAFT_1429685 [Catenaria anguillulae PL171]
MGWVRLTMMSYVHTVRRVGGVKCRLKCRKGCNGSREGRLMTGSVLESVERRAPAATCRKLRPAYC